MQKSVDYLKSNIYNDKCKGKQLTTKILCLGEVNIISKSSSYTQDIVSWVFFVYQKGVEYESY